MGLRGGADQMGWSEQKCRIRGAPFSRGRSGVFLVVCSLCWSCLTGDLVRFGYMYRYDVSVFVALLLSVAGSWSGPVRVRDIHSGRLEEV